MSISTSSRRLAGAVVGGLAAVVFSLGTPAFASHGERHASEQGQQASAANARSSSHAQSGDHAQNDEAAARRDAAPAPAGGGGGGGGGQEAGSNGDTQGASPSNPDGGGIDKPECGTAGNLPCQGTSDFDGNNGCGNDADREDDNNGNCGGPEKPKDCPPNNDANNGRGAENANPRSRIRECGSTPPITPENTPTNPTGSNPPQGNVVDTGNVLSSVVTATETVSAATTEAGGATVLGVSFERPAAEAQAAPARTRTEVMGVQFERGQLARTGFGVILLVLVGLGLIGTGSGLKRLARRS